MNHRGLSWWRRPDCDRSRHAQDLVRDADEPEGPGLVEREGKGLRRSPVHVHEYAQVVHGEGMELGFGAQGESDRVSDVKGELRGGQTCMAHSRRGPPD